MSTRTKLGRTRYFLDELKYSLKNKLYATQLGGLKLYQISEMLIDETYAGKAEHSEAKALWDSIDELAAQYRGPHSDKINENLNTLNIRS